jgi:hypothetical protein
MPNSLLNPNQMRANGVIVDDCPTHLSFNKSSTHFIFFPEQNIHLPLQLHGIISYLSVRKATQLEIETCEWLELTSKEDWDPYAESFEEDEMKHHDIDGISSQKSVDERILCSMSTAFDNDQHLRHSVFNTSAVSSKVKNQLMPPHWQVYGELVSILLRVPCLLQRKNLFYLQSIP